MRTSFISSAAVAVLLCMPVFCANAEAVQVKVPVETLPAARMETRTRDSRDPGIFGDYWWANRFLSRHQQIEKVRGKTVDLVLLGDSIMHFWEWKHPASWGKLANGRTVLNLGYGGDRTQHVIWRVEHGELDGYKAKNIILMIGTNNNYSRDTNPANVALGVQKIISLIRAKQPEARLILHPIFPSGRSADSKRHADARTRNEKTNVLLKAFADTHPEIVWIDFNAKLLDSTGWVPQAIMPDEIHPSDAGYDIWMEAVLPHLRQ